MAAALLDQVHNFGGWQNIFRDLPPMAVSSIADDALDLDKKLVATAQVHFWNAIIDYMISVAYLAPDLTDDMRAAQLEFAVHIQKFVRAAWGKDKALMSSIEEAWVQSLIIGRELHPVRETLLAGGLINRSGQMIPDAED